jgi:hypothetical protein
MVLQPQSKPTTDPLDDLCPSHLRHLLPTRPPT